MHVSAAKFRLTAAWANQQREQLTNRVVGQEKKPDIVMHDLDTKFTKEFTTKLKSRGMRTNPLPKASPNLNMRCERFIETIKLECLNKFIVFGKQQVDHLVREFVVYYNHQHNHMKRDNLPPVRTWTPPM